MKRRILIPLDDETSEKKTADEILAEAFGRTPIGPLYSAQERKAVARFCQFVFYWEHSETVLEVVNKSNFVNSLEEAEACADYIRRHAGVPLKSLPRERSY